MFSKVQSQSLLGLKPFVFRIQNGFLIGMALPPEKGSPCAGCVELWLRDRNVEVEPATVGDLNLRRDLLADLISAGQPHTLYEIYRDGSSHKLDSPIFPHPRCDCSKSTFVPPSQWGESTNFAFSPMYQVKCVRYGTPQGNLWLTGATGESPGTGRLFTTFGVDRNRESSRYQAVERWLKKAALTDLAPTETHTAEDLCTGEVKSLASRGPASQPSGVGAGATRNEAILDGLYQMAKARTVHKYATAVKNPMLVVGANNWLRQRVPFFLIQNYDLHLLFYPNSTPAWVVGVAAMSRVKVDEPPRFVFSTGADIERAFDEALFQILVQCRPSDWRSEEAKRKKQEEPSRMGSKLNMWWTHWIYRCPKITLKDVMQLEPYGTDLEIWRNYFRDGQDPVSIVPLNNPLLPRQLRYLVKIVNEDQGDGVSAKVNGIGSFSHLQQAMVEL